MAKINLIERIESIAGGCWSEWTCELEKADGSIIFGSIQSDGHTHAEETFQPA